jgi:hypothetical protein
LFPTEPQCVGAAPRLRGPISFSTRFAPAQWAVPEVLQPRRRRDGQTKSWCIFVDLIHLTSSDLRRSLRITVDVCCLVFLLPGFYLQEALWLSARSFPTPIANTRRLHLLGLLPRTRNADSTSRLSWQIVAALPSYRRGESREVCVQTIAKALESGPTPAINNPTFSIVDIFATGVSEANRVPAGFAATFGGLFARKREPSSLHSSTIPQDNTLDKSASHRRPSSVTPQPLQPRSPDLTYLFRRL